MHACSFTLYSDKTSDESEVKFSRIDVVIHLHKNLKFTNTLIPYVAKFHCSCCYNYLLRVMPSL